MEGKVDGRSLGRNRKYAYTLYRNADDKLMLLDGTAQQCMDIMNIKKKDSFYRGLSVRNGVTRDWTIIKTPRSQIEADMNDGIEFVEKKMEGRLSRNE